MLTAIRLAELIASIVFSIWRAESEKGRGGGREKLVQVEREAVVKMAKLNIAPPIHEADIELASQAIENIIEGIVVLLNAFGIFPLRKE